MCVTPKVSIIIPVYNVEYYLSQCIDSVLCQSNSDFELLLIDDGSSDTSGKICDDFATKDIRVKVFHKKNGGVSSARNLGLENAKGEWIAFVDSDDYCGKDFISPIFTYNLKNIDIIQVGFSYGLDDSVIRVAKQAKDQLITMSSYFSHQYCRAVCWAHFFRRSMIESNSLRFNPVLAYSEDKEFVYKSVLLSEKVQIVSTSEYFYRFNINSAVNMIRNYSKSRSDLEVLMNMFSFISVLNIDVCTSIRHFLFASLCRAYLYSLITCESVFFSKIEIKKDLRYIISHPLFKSLSLYRILQFRICLILPEFTILMLKFRIQVVNFVKNRILAL